MPAKGHRGNLTLCNELNRGFGSQNEAAKKLGLNPSEVSKQIRGLIPDANGYTFRNLGENMNEQMTIFT
jgi:hypothetical protein